ncbi:hypothetical protein AAFC00_007243 [Neodothiora populina]|uniref:Ubiquinol-cytochrome c chaperone domain-containing protein n=1 Tax=Neodothiora populina TaxID=2781224 RepID=A0ABR3PHQ4_9PEZI
MSSNSICTSCLRILRQSGRKDAVQGFSSRNASIAALHQRSFSTTPKSAIRMTIEDIREQSPTGTSPTARTRTASEDPNDISAMQKFAQRIRAQKTMRATTEPYVAYGATEDLFSKCAVAGDYTIPAVKAGEEPPRTAKGEDLGVGTGWWYDELKLKPTFNTWAQVTFVHMYLLTARLRQFPAAHAPTWHQNLLDHFFYAAEDRMAVYHGMSARSIRNRYLKDLFVQWRGVLTAYDEGIIKGDAVLATAVWRNIFGGEDNVDAEHIAHVVAWFRRSLRDLDQMQDAEIASGEISFQDPVKTLAIVGRESKLLKTAFQEADLVIEDASESKK